MSQWVYKMSTQPHRQLLLIVIFLQLLKRRAAINDDHMTYCT
jgi:hypothetical protein